jgi:hypothetical protein
MHNDKGDLVARSENYARLSVPYICPRDNSANTEQVKGDVMIGSRLVNHLANKVVSTMFPQDRPFFTAALTPAAKREVRKSVGKGQEAAYFEAIRASTVSVEQEAMRTMNLIKYRPQAVEAIKHLIVTGNGLIRRLADNSRVVYGIKDYCVRRNIQGAQIEILLRDAKKFQGLDENLKQRVKQKRPLIQETDDVVLYTHYKLHGDRWHFRQAVDDEVIDNVVRFTPKALPVLALTWTLARGEHYGRGLVEDQIVGFHNIDVSTCALIDMIGVMADIKFLVDPASMLDVQELNNSPRGSYHAGRKDDISTPEGARNLEIGILRETISMWERELSQSFLLNSSAIRDAERVTAEEVRYVAQELNAAYGGLYSRLAIEWQHIEAEYAISQINFDKDIGGKLSLFEIVVTTGLESLSREGQLQNLRSAIGDLQMLEAVPEEIRGTINPLKFASFVFTNHTVNMAEFMFSEEELAANKQAAMAEQQQLAGIQATANVQQKAGEKAVQESEV